MSDYPSRLEFLPNEIFIDIFQYFDARDLYQAFYNLNSRFNALLQSLKNLYFTLLTFNPNDNDDYNIFSSYIYTLILGDKANINLNSFPNIHRLKLIAPTYEQLKQIKYGILSHLEYLSIGYQNIHFSFHMPNICDKIFSNNFPNLKSCDLFEPKVITQIICTKQLTTLRILKIGTVNTSSYQMILLVCPNLYFLQFTALDSYEKQCHIKPHKNLKRMIIKYVEFVEPLNDGDTDLYLSFVPNLEQLIIHRTNADSYIKKFLNYQWIALFIDRHLPLLRRFKCYFHVYLAKKLIENDHENIINLIKENFKQIHYNNRYQSQFICNLSPLSFWQI